jgi:hypothetical protein
LLLLGRQEPISMQPMADGLKQFIADQFAQRAEEAAPPPSGRGRSGD